MSTAVPTKTYTHRAIRQLGADELGALSAEMKLSLSVEDM